MPSVALATCTDPPAGFDRNTLDAVDAPLVAALTARGVEVVRPSWRDETVDWSAHDVVVVRTTWDYPSRRDAFVDWAGRVEALTTLVNPADVVRWNTHKSYLLELEERGAPVVPTAWIGAGDDVDLAALLAARGWSRAVVKPAVGAGSDGLRYVGPDGHDDGQTHLDGLLAVGDALVQPYQPEVERRGELSVVVIDGAVTHAVRKVPADGDFRVQRSLGARVRPETATDEVVRLAGWVVEATGVELVYARVDLLADERGTWQLAELEATEPDLYLRDAPAAAERFADALVARIG